LSDDFTINKTTLVLPSGETRFGSIIFQPDRPFVKLDTGQVISFSEDIQYEVNQKVLVGIDGKRTQVKLERPLRIQLMPISIAHQDYSLIPKLPEDIFPPSSYYWYGRLNEKGINAIYIVQNIVDDSRHWLTIVDHSTNSILEAHEINPYEAFSLTIAQDNDVWKQAHISFGSDNPELLRKEILAILDGPSPDKERLFHFLKDAEIPGFYHTSDIRGIVEQLIPHVFDQSARQELMAFLAWILTQNDIDEDPVVFFNKLLVTPILSFLLAGHLHCVYDGIPPPPYMKLIHMATRDQLRSSKRIIRERLEESPWGRLFYRLNEQFPSWESYALQYAKKLNETREILSRLPVSKAEAKKSKQKWKERFALTSSELRLRIHTTPEAFGLRQILYIGAAYRWNTIHTAWSTRLGKIDQHVPHLQVLVMPTSAAEQVKRIMPSCVQVEWSARVINPDLYDFKRKKWRSTISRNTESISEDVTLQSIGKRFGTWVGQRSIAMTDKMAKVLDFFSLGSHLSLMESPNYWKYIGISRREMQSMLTQLSKDQAVYPYYTSEELGLTSILTLLQGEQNLVYSLVEFLLRNTPTSLAMIGKTSEPSVVISKVPTEDVSHIITDLPNEFSTQEIAVRSMKPRAVKSYTMTLFQRLLQADGSWNDDISGFISQSRSRARE
jgi:hypothetical protein